MSSIGTRLKELRKGLGLTQAELAEKLNISKSAIVQYEGDKRKPNLKALNSIEDFFGVGSNYLMGYSQYKTMSEELFYSNSLLSYEKALEESDQIKNDDQAQAKVFGAALINAQSEFLLSLILITDLTQRNTMMNELYDISSILSSIYFGNYTPSSDMWMDEPLTELAFYKLNESRYNELKSYLIAKLDNVFTIRNSQLYDDYIKNFDKVRTDKEYLTMVDKLSKEIKKQGINKYTTELHENTF